MEVRFISTLTLEDEERIASALLAALGTMLDVFAIPYTLKIETGGAKVLHRTNPASDTLRHAEVTRIDPFPSQ